MLSPSAHLYMCACFPHQNFPSYLSFLTSVLLIPPVCLSPQPHQVLWSPQASPPPHPPRLWVRLAWPARQSCPFQHSPLSSPLSTNLLLIWPGQISYHFSKRPTHCNTATSGSVHTQATHTHVHKEAYYVQWLYFLIWNNIELYVFDVVLACVSVIVSVGVSLSVLRHQGEQREREREAKRWDPVLALPPTDLLH